jgi:hypothetical protein
VLSDFAKADSDWLEPMLDAIASAVPHLVAGDDPKFLNEVARSMRPAPVVRKADPADARQPAAAAPEPAPAKKDTGSTPAEAAPVMEPEPAAKKSEPVAPAPDAAASKPAPDPVPPVREKEPAMAGGDGDYRAEVERAQGLATKLRKWFGRS